MQGNDEGWAVVDDLPDPRPLMPDRGPPRWRSSSGLIPPLQKVSDEHLHTAVDFALVRASHGSNLFDQVLQVELAEPPLLQQMRLFLRPKEEILLVDAAGRQDGNGQQRPIDAGLRRRATPPLQIAPIEDGRRMEA